MVINIEIIKSFISWVVGKSKLLWLIHLLFPKKVGRFIDVFGGSGTVLLSHPVVSGTLEVYNDFNSNLTNYYKLIRYSFSSNAKSFGGKGCDIRKFFCDIWSCSRRLADVVVENKDCVSVIRQYDRPDALIYCEPPYVDAEGCYAVEFPQEDHKRLHDALAECSGYVMVSYNKCDFILDLYKDFYIFFTVRANSMSQTPGSEYEELIMTNYDSRSELRSNMQLTLFPYTDFGEETKYTLIHIPEKPLKTSEALPQNPS